MNDEIVRLRINPKDVFLIFIDKEGRRKKQKKMFIDKDKKTNETSYGKKRMIIK